MCKKRSRPSEEKIEILHACESGEYSLNEICSFYHVHHQTIKAWQEKYNKHGMNGLREVRSKKRYPEELKRSAIKDYESGKYSLRDEQRTFSFSINVSNKRLLLAGGFF